MSLDGNHVRHRVFSGARRAPILPVFILTIFIGTAILAPWIAPHPSTAVNLSQSLRPPAWQGGTMDHILGTDKLGRDILSRVVYGSRVSLVVAALAIGISGVIGVTLGTLAGYRRSWTELLVMQLVDIGLSVPMILLALLFAVLWGPQFSNLLLVIVLTQWALYARQAHAETLSLKERDYVLAARALGGSQARLLIVHIFPNLVNSMIILATLQIAQVVLIEASLSFLGVGIPPPTPAWGLMIADGRGLLVQAWWVSTMPGVALSLIVLSANMVGDSIRDYLDPTLRHR